MMKACYCQHAGTFQMTTTDISAAIHIMREVHDWPISYFIECNSLCEVSLYLCKRH